MVKFLKKKNLTEFLNSDYPENIAPIIKLSRKQKKLIQEKKNIFRKLKKRINIIKKNLLNLELTNNPLKPFIDKEIFIFEKKGSIKTMELPKNYKKDFIFSSDQLKNQILANSFHFRNSSEFLVKLKERKKFSIFYGNISKKFLKKSYKNAKRVLGKTNENFLIQFEKRLDVVLNRICFCKTIYSAKQYITHNYVLVNGIIVNIPSYQVKTGDVISIVKSKRDLLTNILIDNIKSKLRKRKLTPLLSFKYLQSEKNINTVLSKIELKLKILIKRQNYSSLKKQNNNYNKLKEFKNHKQKIKIQLIKDSLFNIKLLKKQLLFYNQDRKNNILLKNKIYLYFKKLMQQKRPRYHLLSAMKISSMKPLHIEVSYKQLTAIILYPPQKINYPFLVDTAYLLRSFNR